MRKNWYLNFITLYIGVTLFYTSCGNKVKEPEQVILAKVADRQITLDEFIKRAEYTIRPPYCKGDNYIHKKIILNSLLAEKLMALEEGQDNEMLNSKEFQDYIRGRKEQAMRKWLLKKEGFEKVKLDTNDIKDAYRWVGREYKVSYLTVPNEQLADSVKRLLDKTGNDFDTVYEQFSGNTEVPTNEVGWQREGNDAIIEALYSDSLRVGQIVGPIRAEDDVYTTIRIDGWTETLALTDEQIKLRWNDVRERLGRMQAESIYAEFVSDIMSGKSMEFEEQAFWKLVDILKPFYVVSPEKKQELLNQRFWKKETPEIDLDQVENEFEEIKDWPILTIEGETWTVERLRNEIALHPLVFRKRTITDNNFPKQFKLAVVDMIRDKYLTNVAYDRGYDQVNVVEQNALMWQDYAVSLYHRNTYLERVGNEFSMGKDYMKAFNEYLNPYVDSLQTKYSDQVEIDTKMFEAIELTRIDMFVMEKNVPYPVAVPSFPILTSDNKLDYGKDVSTVH